MRNIKPSCVCLLTILAAAPFAPAEPSTRFARLLEAVQSKIPYDVKRDLTYATAGEEKLLLDAYVPKAAGPFPGVLVVHGGAWTMGSKQQLSAIAHALAARGFSAFAINYRLAPKHKFPAQIEDCRSAVRWVVDNAAAYKVDAARLGAIGYSAGGHLVALLGAQGVEPAPGKKGPTIRLKAVAAGGAPCDFRSMPAKAMYLAYWLGGTREDKPEVYKAASPAAFVGPLSAATFFYNGENDSLVKPASARAMHEALRKAKVPTEFHLVKGAGHMAAASNLGALMQAFEFLNKHLTNAGKAKPAKPASAEPAKQ